jgi:hypothetical protein
VLEHRRLGLLPVYAFQRGKDTDIPHCTGKPV